MLGGFDPASQRLIAETVRKDKYNTGGVRQVGTGSHTARQPSTQVMIVGERDDGNGMFPGVYVYYNSEFITCNYSPTTTTANPTTPFPQGATTTSTSTTSTTSTTPAPTTTTTNAPWLKFSTAEQDCWVMIKETDVEEVEIGDVFDATVVGQLKDDGLPISLVSYKFGETCPGSTTTTTLEPCSGSCRYTWNPVTRTWTEVESTCEEGCNCVPPTSCNKYACGVEVTPCTSSNIQPQPIDCFCTTSTTTTPAPCSGSCVYGCVESLYTVVSDDCSAGCDCVLVGTACETGGEIACERTTTTTPAPGGCSGCDWEFVVSPGDSGTWFLVSSDCNGNDCALTCSPPNYTPTECVGGVHTNCDGLPQPNCTGKCQWVNGRYGGWRLRTGTSQCNGRCSYRSDSNSGCSCPQPSRAPGCNDSAETACGCVGGGTLDPNQMCTTTRRPDCLGDCYYAWNDTSSQWVYSGTDCATGCTCVEPDYGGDYDCQNANTACNGTSTTTTTPEPTTTTSTTLPPCEDRGCYSVVSAKSSGGCGSPSCTVEFTGCCGTVVDGACVPDGECPCSSPLSPICYAAACSEVAATVGMVWRGEGGCVGTTTVAPTTTTASPTTTTASPTTTTSTTANPCEGSCNYSCSMGMWVPNLITCPETAPCFGCHPDSTNLPGYPTCVTEGQVLGIGCGPSGGTTTSAPGTTTTSAPGTTTTSAP